MYTIRNLENDLIEQHRNKKDFARRIQAQYMQWIDDLVLSHETDSKKSQIDAMDLLDWLDSEENKEIEKKQKTHKQITVRKGVTNCPGNFHKLWIRK
jgi:hypothetical protein